MAEADFRLMTEATGQRIAAALEALHLATVTGVKGDAEQNYRHGDVNITPANIGAPTTTGSGASGIWNINIPFSGSGTTGFKSFSLNEINIDDTPGSWVAGFSDRTNHGTFPTWNKWWTIVRQYESEGFIFQVANQLTNLGTSSYMSFRGKWNNDGSWGPWKDIINYDAVPITSGGTGATTPAGAISKLFDISANDVHNYPNAPGVYRTVGTNIFSNLQPGSPYGVLIIIGREYAAHFYIDAYSHMYVGFSGEVFGEPTTWRKCTA